MALVAEDLKLYVRSKINNRHRGNEEMGRPGLRELNYRCLRGTCALVTGMTAKRQAR